MSKEDQQKLKEYGKYYRDVKLIDFKITLREKYIYIFFLYIYINESMDIYKRIFSFQFGQQFAYHQKETRKKDKYKPK